MRKTRQPGKEPKSSVEPPRPSVTSLTVAQLGTMTTDELVKLLMSPELAESVNASLREQVIVLLQEREGNHFVRRVLGLSPGEEVA